MEASKKKASGLGRPSLFILLAAVWGTAILPAAYASEKGALKASSSGVAFDLSRERKITEEALHFLEEIRERSGGEALIPIRNLFEEWRGPRITEIRLVLEAVERKEPPITYKGLIEDEDGVITAQLNFEGVSKFVKEGDEVLGWRIERLTKEEARLTRPGGEEKTIGFRAEIPAIDARAVVVREPDGKTFRLREGETVEDFRIIRIGEDFVTLEKGGQEVTLRRGSGGVILGQKVDS